MNDRVPTYPGRVKLTPVAGQENTYDMTMADEPTQEGTPPTKANLLSDATIGKILQNLGASVTTPNEALNALAYAPVNISTGSYVGTGAYGSSNPSTLTFPFVPKMVIITLPQDSYPVDGGWRNMALWIEGATFVKTKTTSAGAVNVRFDVAGNTLSWYSTSSTDAAIQLNAAGGTYRYFAIG